MPSASSFQSRTPLPITSSICIPFGTFSCSLSTPANRIVYCTVVVARISPSPSPTNVCTSANTRAACSAAFGISRCQRIASDPVDGSVASTTRLSPTTLSDCSFAFVTVKSRSSRAGTDSCVVVAPAGTSWNSSPLAPSAEVTATAKFRSSSTAPRCCVTSV